MEEKRGFRWGFQWWKVGAGLALLIPFGTLTVLAWKAGYFSPYITVGAGAGLIMILSGLIGEEASNDWSPD